MDWYLFWSAFGAIGSTIGSIVTAVAVVIAVKQYMQPLKKIVNVEFSFSVSSYLGNKLDFYCVVIQNRGIRQVQIESIYIKGYKKRIWLNNAVFSINDKTKFPISISPEDSKTFLFEVKHLNEEIKRIIEEGSIRKNAKLVIFAEDSLGDKYYCKTNMRIKNLIKTVEY